MQFHASNMVIINCGELLLQSKSGVQNQPQHHSQEDSKYYCYLTDSSAPDY